MFVSIDPCAGQGGHRCLFQISPSTSMRASEFPWGCTGTLLTPGASGCLERVNPLTQNASLPVGCVCELVTGGCMGTVNICLGEAFPEAPPVPGLCPGSPARSSQLAAAASGAGLGFGAQGSAAGNAVLRRGAAECPTSKPPCPVLLVIHLLAVLWTFPLVISEDVLEELACGPL